MPPSENLRVARHGRSAGEEEREPSVTGIRHAAFGHANISIDAIKGRVDFGDRSVAGGRWRGLEEFATVRRGGGEHHFLGHVALPQVRLKIHNATLLLLRRRQGVRLPQLKATCLMLQSMRKLRLVLHKAVSTQHLNP